MVSEKIKEYVDNARKAGYSDSQIRETLKKVGWQDKDINDALGVSSPTLTAPPPPQPIQPSISQVSVSLTEKDTSQVKPKKTNTLAIIAFIASFFISIVGLILGIVALHEIKKSGEKGKGFAVAAIIISIIGIVLTLLLFLMVPMMAYFGVMDPARLLPERCQFPAGMDCIDRAAITSSEITVALRNNQGFPIKVKSATSTKCNGAQISVEENKEFVALNSNLVNNNAVFLIKLTGCNNGGAGAKVEKSISITYENTESGLQNTVEGDVRGRVG
jgi:hypothetical protein